MKNITFSKAMVPNSFTAMNALSGFIALILTSDGQYKYAAMCIIIAALFDILDGLVARMLGTSSQFGVELDSLADIISFGAAPSFLIYESYLDQFGIVGIGLSSLNLLFGAFRLARFNVQVDDISTKKDFKGLPIPLSGVSLATLVLAFYHDGEIIKPYDNLVIPIVLIVSFLMISKIKYKAFPKMKKKSILYRIVALILLLAAITVILITDGSALFYIFISIVLFGIFNYFISFLKKKKKAEIKTNN